MTRWPVLQEHPVTAADLDADGAVTDAATERWITAARDAYLDHSASLRRLRERPDLEVRCHAGGRPPGMLLGRPANVAVSAGVSEILPDSFRVAVRLRPLDGDRDTPVSASDTIALVDRPTGEALPIGDDLRDELVATEHAAQHLN